MDKVNFQNSNLAGTKLTKENPEHVIYRCGHLVVLNNLPTYQEFEIRNKF
ncbi:hypothetical protein BH18THE1_BH18THE1_03070 [soil metagenome]